MHKEFEEDLALLKELTTKRGETPRAALWETIDWAVVKCEGGRAYLFDIYRHVRRASFSLADRHVTYPEFRDHFVAICEAIGLRTEKQGERVFILMPEEHKAKLAKKLAGCPSILASLTGD